jgi:nucleotide-binding universal stress UspA family protein
MTISAEPARATPLPVASHVPATTARGQGIRHVLVCLDRSLLAEACLLQARFIADAFGARMTLLHVLASHEGDQTPSRSDALDWELARREAEQYLTEIQIRLEQQGFARERVATEVTQGRPAERIVTVARGIDADLTVLSSHGEGGIGSCNLGSTTQQVLALTPGSVLVAPSDVGASRSVPAKRILVAVDGSLRNQSVLPEVAQLARYHGAEVLLVHIVAEPKPTAVLSTEDDLSLARLLASRLQVGAERYLSQLRERLFAEIAGVETLVLREPDERRALLDAAVQRQADLLVLAAHGTTCDAERPFGSVAAYVLAHGKLPLLVLQDLSALERESVGPNAQTTEGPPNVRASFDARPLEET